MATEDTPMTRHLAAVLRRAAMSEEARPARDLSHLWLGAAVVGILAGAALYAAGQPDAANVALGDHHRRSA